MTKVEAEERRVRDLLYPPRRSVQATPIKPPIKPPPSKS